MIETQTAQLGGKLTQTGDDAGQYSPEKSITYYNLNC